ncbi:MAG: hypothetical protein FWF50_07430 [Defluviitaleaceae bacterium]|nr:hypothetical protein [Defluviitaleaceae bacterium]
MNKKSFARKMLVATLAFGLFTVPAYADEYEEYEEYEEVVAVSEESPAQGPIITQGQTVPIVIETPAAPGTNQQQTIYVPAEFLEFSAWELRLAFTQGRITHTRGRLTAEEFHAVQAAIMRARLSVIIPENTAIETPVVEAEEDDAEEYYYEEETQEED